MAQLGQDPQISVAVAMPQVIHGYLQKTHLSNLRHPLQLDQTQYLCKTQNGVPRLSVGLCF